MPAVSQKQRSFLFATKGKKWAEAHHFDNKGHLPKYKRKKRTVPKPDRHDYY